MIEELRERDAFLTQQIENLRQERVRVRNAIRRQIEATQERRSGMADEVWVETPRLAELIALWARETDGTQRLLANRATVSTRQIRRILNGETPHTTLDTADRLLTAIGAPWKISELPTVKRHLPGRPPSQFYEE